MTTHRLTLTVAGKLGPYDVLTEEAVRGLADRLSAGSQIAVRLPTGELALGTITGEVTVDELTPGRYAVHADADLDDATEPTHAADTAAIVAAAGELDV